MFRTVWRKAREEVWEGVIGQVVRWLLALIGGPAAVWKFFRHYGASMELALSMVVLVMIPTWLAIAFYREWKKSKTILAQRTPIAPAPNPALASPPTMPELPSIQPPPAPSFIRAPKARFDIAAVGIIRDVEIRLFPKRQQYRCRCLVDFCGLRGGSRVTASPSLLRLTEEDGKGKVVDLEPTSISDIPGSATYEGWANVVPRWECVSAKDPSQRMICAKVAVQIPTMWRTAHQGSGVRLDYELTSSGLPVDEDHRAFVVEVTIEPEVMTLSEAVKIIATPD